VIYAINERAAQSALDCIRRGLDGGGMAARGPRQDFFSKLARSVLRHIRVASKQELKDRIMAAMD
jgi:hypothetical protein